MSVSPNTQAVLLLTAHFSKARKGAVKPLTPKEWGRFALWLKEKSLIPEQLMTGRLDEILNCWSDKAITLDRVRDLMGRGSALALAMEKWLRAGLWVMTRSDPDYPMRFKQRLKTDSPALLFGCGNRALLNGVGLAVIGSRNASEKDLAYSRDLGSLAAGNGSSIVSGGARGVDEASMLGALEAEGTVIGVLALPFPHKSADIYTPTQQVSLTQNLKNRVPPPHYLMPWRRIIFAPEVPTKRGYQLYGLSQLCGGGSVFFAA